jgi:hypothetical protein
MSDADEALKVLARAMEDGTFDLIAEEAARGPHPRDEDLRAYDAGTLAAEDARVLGIHLMLCVECRVRARMLARGEHPDTGIRQLSVRAAWAGQMAAAALLPSAGPPAHTGWQLTLFDGDEIVRLDELAEGVAVREVQFYIRDRGDFTYLGGVAIQAPPGPGLRALFGRRRSGALAADAPLADLPMGPLTPGRHPLLMLLVMDGDAVNERELPWPDGVIPVAVTEAADADQVRTLIARRAPLAILEVG